MNIRKFVPFINERDHIGRLVTRKKLNNKEKLYYKQRKFLKHKKIKHMCDRKFLPKLSEVP